MVAGSTPAGYDAALKIAARESPDSCARRFLTSPTKTDAAS
jgi:hypothetical protein